MIGRSILSLLVRVLGVIGELGNIRSLTYIDNLIWIRTWQRIKAVNMSHTLDAPDYTSPNNVELYNPAWSYVLHFNCSIVHFSSNSE